VIPPLIMIYYYRDREKMIRKIRKHFWVFLRSRLKLVREEIRESMTKNPQGETEQKRLNKLLEYEND